MSVSAPHDLHGRAGEGTAVCTHAGRERVELHDPADDRARLAVQRGGGGRGDCRREWEDEPDSGQSYSGARIPRLLAERNDEALRTAIRVREHGILPRGEQVDTGLGVPAQIAESLTREIEVA